MNQFDIIGDVHGHATELRQLLSKLGYQQTQSGYQHPKRTALFVGDFIDRGPAQLEVLDIVRTMIENRAARAVMGNHEFNAIGWFSRNDNGEPLREHTEKNRKQHAAFLNEVGENSAQHKEWISWFKTLPLWLELPELQIIHACWNPLAMTAIRPFINAHQQLQEQQLVHCYKKGHIAYQAIESLLKGVELPLPAANYFLDKDGHQQQMTRIKWWQKHGSFREKAILPEEYAQHLPAHSLSDEIMQLADIRKPTFIGHYWLQGEPLPRSEMVACVDFSVAKQGQLMAYRFQGESILNPAHFISHADPL